MEKILAAGKMKCSLKIHKIFAHFVRVAKVKISTKYFRINKAARVSKKSKTKYFENY